MVNGCERRSNARASRTTSRSTGVSGTASPTTSPPSRSQESSGSGTTQRPPRTPSPGCTRSSLDISRPEDELTGVLSGEQLEQNLGEGEDPAVDDVLV